MEPNTRRKYAKLALIVGGVVLLDQITKALVLGTIPLYHSVTVIPGVFDLTHIHNPGGAFGFLADQSAAVRSFLFLFVSLIAAGVVIYFYQATPPTHRLLETGLALILGGAVGNLIDRIRFGRVVDFLDVYWGTFHWPAFNIADSAVSVGVAIFLYHLVMNKMPE